MVNLVSSKLGIFSVSWHEGVIFSDGTINKERVYHYFRNHANLGANFTREMCWLVAEEDAITAPFLKVGNKFDLSKPNPWFYSNLNIMNQIAKNCGLKLIWTLFDFCGTKRGWSVFNPWFNNVQGTKGFHKKEALEYRREYIAGCYEEGVRYFECCNEPTNGYGPMVIDTYQALNELNVPDRNIIHGCQYYGEDEIEAMPRAKKQTLPYWVWKLFRKSVYRDYGKDLRGTVCSTRHRLDDNFVDMIIESRFASRRFNLSFDGIKNPTKKMISELVYRLLRYGTKQIFKKEWYIEVLNNHDNGRTDDLCLALAEAVKQHTGKYPHSFGKYPQVLPEPDPPVVDPDPIVIDPVPDPPELPGPVAPPKKDNRNWFQKLWDWFLGLFG